MAQRINSKAKTFLFGTVSLNEVLNPNLQFQSLYSQNLFEEHKVVVDNIWSLKPQNFQNQNLEYAYGKTISALAQHLQNLQNQFVVLETEKFQMLKNQEKQENHIKDLQTELEPLNNVSKTDLINIIKKSALLTQQFEKHLVKNKFGPDIYNIIESYFLDKYYEKVFKNQCILYEQFRTKNSGIKTGYMCDAPKPGGPLTTRQPAEYKWMSGYPTPLQKIGQSLLCTGSSTQIQYLHILSQTM